MADSVYRCLDANGLLGEIREDLDSVYAFRPSNASIYAFDSEALRRTERPQELISILKAAGHEEDGMERLITKFVTGTASSGCAYTGRRIRDADYVILVPDSDDWLGWCQKIGGQVMHGEHWTEHSRGQGASYIERFSELAVAFFRGLGENHVMRRITKGKGYTPHLHVDRTIYDRGNSRLDLRLGHIAGYQMAYQLPEGAPLKRMFHEPEERKVWDMYNGSLTPVIDIILPCEGVWDPGRIEGIVNGALRSKGLKADVRVSVDSNPAGLGPTFRPPS